MRSQRSGFSLVEVLVSMLLLGLLSGSIASLVLSAVRTADRSRERARQEGTLRELGAVVEREVRDVAPARDIGGFSAESVTYRAGRGSGYTCGIEGGGVVVRDADYRAWRLPDAVRDSVLVLLPDDSLAGPASWAVSPLLAAPGRGHCRDGAPGVRLSIDPAIVLRASVADLPVRVFEWMRLRLYESGGSWWVGARSLRAGDVVQPIAGPVAARGLSLGWLDGSGAVAALADAELLEVRLVAATMMAPGPGRAVVPDTLRTTIGLRNGGGP
jgi:prepilin-type N-terminal cleavage/methylation domain-containing protein